MKKGSLKILGLALLIILASVSMVACSMAPKTSETQNTAGTYNRTEIITTSNEAKQLLIDGNKRFMENKLLNDDISDTRLKGLSANGQHPFAVIVSCSDSRVPPEVIFDQGLGDIFVVRDAGNVIDPVVLGSVEYGAEHLHAPLIVVLGHEGCGAVKATVDGGEAPGSIGAIVEKIKPSLEKAKATGAISAALYEKTADENIKAAIAAIEKRHIIKELAEENKVKIVGAKYHLETGEVVFSE